jgi:hypothetical protein
MSTTRVPRLALLATLTIASLAAAQGIRPMPPTSQPTSRPAISPALGLAASIEVAHGAAFWPDGKAVRARVTVSFGGSEVFAGVMTYDRNTSRCRIETDDAVVVFDGAKTWVRPDREAFPQARFHILTWPYFLAAPFKLRDPGGVVVGGGLKTMDGRMCKTARLTFEAGTGDTPEDWYVIYGDPQTQRLLALAYIVTYGTPAADAEKAPHVAVYREFTTVDRVVLPTAITFHDWDEKTGAHEARIGMAQFEGIEFVPIPADAFDRPDGAVEDPLP